MKDKRNAYECMICPYSLKRRKEKELMCNWDGDENTMQPCSEIKACGNWEH